MKRLTLILVILSFSLPLRAASGLEGFPPGKWWEHPRLVEKLDLSEEQQQEIGRRVYEHAMRMIELKAAVEKADLALKESAEREDFQEETVRSAFRAFQHARLELEAERFEMLLSVRQVLKTEQWRELHFMRQRFEGTRGERRGRPGAPHRRGGMASPGAMMPPESTPPPVNSPENR